MRVEQLAEPLERDRDELDGREGRGRGAAHAAVDGRELTEDRALAADRDDELAPVGGDPHELDGALLDDEDLVAGITLFEHARSRRVPLPPAGLHECFDIVGREELEEGPARHARHATTGSRP